MQNYASRWDLKCIDILSLKYREMESIHLDLKDNILYLNAHKQEQIPAALVK